MVVSRLILAALVGTVLVPSTTHQDQELSRLTVPAERLPKGCRLAPPLQPEESGRPRTDYPPLGPNPWVGHSPGGQTCIRRVGHSCHSVLVVICPAR